MYNVVLLSPKIPQNVGAIGRTCVCTGAVLNVIAPTPIDFSEKRLRRAGLDYWRYLEFRLWSGLEQFLEANPITKRHFFFTTKTRRPYFDVRFADGDFLWFGSEDAGIPESFWRSYEDRAITMPMRPPFRSLNLANAVSIALYECVRQNYGESVLQ
ncbi:MAG: tRNA (cytidine(34)-2'-O)-methyltransferase [Helicobacteraceae bacterium]|jgi:tRNA (cytidine/uridine-2'-O-)-methyltransferase|nr:tRNA (cytidine(34)-2'-O)-methyltransferase [Helicobacteraceae bacterium]